MYTDIFSLCSEVLRSTIAQKAIDMGFEPSVVEKTILEKISTTGSGFSSLGELVEAYLGAQENSSAKSQEQGIIPHVSRTGVIV